MRFRSAAQDGFVVSAVTGINTVSFGLSATPAARKELLGFAVERIDPVEDEQYFMRGFKVFRSLVPTPDATTRPSTHEHPVQSLVWDDFTAKPGRPYEYRFHPLRGKPKKLDRSAAPVVLRVRTEPLTGQTHDVFFNRGVASSQAYGDRFGTGQIEALPDARREEALAWLGRDLPGQLLRFVELAVAGDALLCAFYEFRYEPVARALKQAIDRGVDVRLVVDAKDNGNPSKFEDPFPRDENLDQLRSAKIPNDRVILREARKNDIQHNKFMILVRGGNPIEVWTGSTNLSAGGLHGQTNVGHWIRDAPAAVAFRSYWELLAADPGGRVGDTSTVVRQRNRAQAAANEAVSPLPADLDAIPAGTTAIFSPRSTLDALDLYIRLLDEAEQCGCVTLAFGVNASFKSSLSDNAPDGSLTLLLLEKKDAPTASSTKPFVRLTAGNNVYEAWGSHIAEPVHQWARETNAKRLRLNSHVSYVHSKFLLRDPLSADPIVVTGSANFSDASTRSNDENMLIVRGDTRVADIYFTEFNRLFNHYYFRAVQAELSEKGTSDDSELFLKEDASWLGKYTPGKLRSKRLALYTSMAGIAVAADLAWPA